MHGEGRVQPRARDVLRLKWKSNQGKPFRACFAHLTPPRFRLGTVRNFDILQRADDPHGEEGIIPRKPILDSSDEFDRSANKLLRLAALEADLNAVVEQMHAELSHHGNVSEESAEQVRLLLQRARLL